MSDGFLRELGDSELWSVSRDLARNVDRYKALLPAADEPRRGDRDGRRTLTKDGLGDFRRFFLEVCIDQVDYMRALLEPNELLSRVKIWAIEDTKGKRFPKGASGSTRGYSFW